MIKRACIQLAGMNYDLAVSNIKSYIAIKHRDKDGFNEQGSPNIFVYDTAGSIAFSFISSHGGERGIAFWPNDNYVITTGCGHSQNWKADGIKQWLIGNHALKHLFSDTPLTGINTHLHGVTPQGRYILGTNHSGSWIIDTRTNDTISMANMDIFSAWLVFSQDEKYTGVAKNIFLRIDDKGLLLDNSSGKVIWEKKEEPVLAFHPNNTSFLTTAFGKVILRTLPSAEKLNEFPFDGIDGITAAAYSQDGSKLAIGPVSYKYVFIFNTRNMELVDQLCLDDQDIHYGNRRIRLLKFTAKDELIVGEIHSKNSQWHTQIGVWK